MKRRVLFLYHVSTIGGGSYCMLNLLKAIDRRHFEPVVVLPQNGPLSKELNKLGIQVDYYPNLVLYPYNQSLFRIDSIRTILRIERAKKGLLKVIKKVSPEIVYLNTMMLFPYLEIAKSAGCKTVIHIREHWPLDEHKKQLDYARNCVYENADKVIAINRYSASLFPKREVVIVYDWIDMEARRGGKSISELLGEESDNNKVYLFTGGMQLIKGTLEVIETFTKYIKGENRRLLCLGVDPKVNWIGLRGMVKKVLSLLGYETYSEKIYKLCKRDKRVICAPAMYEMTDLMEKVDGCVSYFTIPHANLALAESIILGTAAIAAETDESLEYTDEGRLAHLYPLGNLRSFAETWLKFDQGSLMVEVKDATAIKEKFSADRNAIVYNETLRML